MKVAFDVTPLLGLRTGIGRSVEEMLRAVQQRPDAPAVLPFALGASAPQLASDAPAGTATIGLPTRAVVAAWSRTDLPRLDRWVRGSSLLHATNFVVPPTRLPTLVTVHDLSFLLHPDTVNSVTARFGPLLRRALARGVHVHTATEQVADEVEEHLAPGLRAQGRLHVVPFGVPVLGEAGSLPPEVQAALAGRPYLLALGRVETRKDLVTLVRAFGLLADGDEGLCLVLAGPPGSASEAVGTAVAALPPATAARVLRLGAVDEPTRVGLLTGAQALAYPSRYEGFGFPVLEAMTAGVPVVAADLPVLREVAGGAALHTAVGDAPALADSLTLLLTDEDRRRTLVAAGRSRAAEFTWERTGAGLVAAYRRVASTSS